MNAFWQTSTVRTPCGFSAEKVEQHMLTFYILLPILLEVMEKLLHINANIGINKEIDYL
jgi:hypothetical protein